jgi:hypothetical protein
MNVHRKLLSSWVEQGRSWELNLRHPETFCEYDLCKSGEKKEVGLFFVILLSVSGVSFKLYTNFNFTGPPERGFINLMPSSLLAP